VTFEVSGCGMPTGNPDIIPVQAVRSLDSGAGNAAGNAAEQLHGVAGGVGQRLVPTVNLQP
jgi:hypothetical protein